MPATRGARFPTLGPRADICFRAEMDKSLPTPGLMKILVPVMFTVSAPAEVEATCPMVNSGFGEAVKDHSASDRLSPVNETSACWELAEAKGRFFTLVRRAHFDGPQRVTVGGRLSCMVISAVDYDQLEAAQLNPRREKWSLRFQRCRAVVHGLYGTRFRKGIGNRDARERFNPPRGSADRWKLEYAQNNFLGVFRRAHFHGPQLVTVRSRRSVIVIRGEHYDRLSRMDNHADLGERKPLDKLALPRDCPGDEALGA